MNTYQGILVGDGSNSFSIFTYTCGDIEWSSIGTEAAVVGYNIFGDFKNEVGSGLSSVGESIACSVVIDGNRRRRRQLDPTVTSYLNMIPASATVAEKKETCQTGLDNDAKLFSTADLADLLLPDCPTTRKCATMCTKQFQPDPQNSNCFISLTPGSVTDSNSGSVYMFNQQCCYSASG